MTLPSEEQACARCGKPSHQWQESSGQGYESGGQTYCCRGCAENTGCTCMTGVAGK